MREVENYVEHIRSLSDEREALTLEFETENEQLKGQINELKQQIDGDYIYIYLTKDCISICICYSTIFQELGLVQ